MGQVKHNQAGTRLYQMWINIKSRCANKNNPKYSYYGGKGVTVCDEWLKDFQAFHDYAYANGYNDTLTIHRIDGSKGYEPGNCRFISFEENRLNGRTPRKSPSKKMRTRLIEERKKHYRTQVAIAEALNITVQHYQRLEYGTANGSITLWQRMADKFGTPIDAIVKNYPSTRTEACVTQEL